MTKRITFDVDDAEHIYEWLYMYWHRGGPKPDPKPVFVGEDSAFAEGGGCYMCQKLGKRLEHFIGPRRVRRTRKAVKKNPG